MICDNTDDVGVSEPGEIINKPKIEIPFANNHEKSQFPCGNPGQIIIEENEHNIVDEVEYTTDSGISFRNDNGIE